MCQKCGQPSYVNCNCVQISQQNCCNNTGCPVQLDFTCVLYHKDNNQVSQLTGLGLTNGATLQLFAESVDVYIRQLKVSTWSLPCLRTNYTVNTLQQFGEAVDNRLCVLQNQIDEVAQIAGVPITPVDTPSIDMVAVGILDHTISANLKISATAGNQAQILTDGLMVNPQTLSVNYADKKLTISDGNTVDLSALTCGVGGFLGNFSADPTAVDGQYWYRTDLPANSGLRIRLNGIVKTITIS